MCGIAGWIDYERDLRSERSTLEAMTETMRKRGPDDGGAWLSPHAALGHRRLAIIDLAGGKQPMEAKSERGAVVLVYTGEVYNYRELRTELRDAGRRFETASDTEVVLRAYLQWGPAFLERLNGIYAFALWDEGKQELLLVRDRFGVKPLYYQETAGGVLFGSEPKGILAHPSVDAVVDGEGLSALLCFRAKPPGVGVFRGMREVRPGEVVRVRRGSVSAQPYWQLQSMPHRDDLQKTIATVRELLEDIVTRQLVSDVPLGTLLSGGLDSSVITALAHRANANERVRSFSVDFAEAASFKPLGRWDAPDETPDAPFVEECVKYLACEHSNVVLTPNEMADASIRDAVLESRDLPMSFGDLDTSMYLLFRSIRERVTVALSGESADEVFGGYSWFHAPEAIAADTFPWLAMRVARMGSPFVTLVDSALVKKIDAEGYIAQHYRDALAEVPHLAGESPSDRRMREICHLNLTRWLQVLLDRKDRLSMASGLEVRVPFCDHRLVEYVFNVPWAMKTFDGREKSLLRAASTDLLPTSVLQRKKNPYPSVQDEQYAAAVRRQLEELLARPDAPVLPILDQPRARSLVANGASDAASREVMEQALMIDAWLTRYRVRLAL